ncbi:MAG: tyrosine-type recombinase/integrase [Candidatus Binatia bacterium]
MGSRSKRGDGIIYRRGQIWWVKYYDNGRPRYESSRSAKESDAKRLLSLRLGQVVEGKCPAPEAQRAKFEDLAHDLDAEYRVNGRKTQGHLLKRIAYLRQFFGGMRAASITTSDVQRYILKRQAEKGKSGGQVKPATINRELAALKRMFSLAAKATPPKVARVPYIPTLQENNVRGGFFEYEDFEKLRDALPEHLKPFVVFGFYTGWRRGETTNLTWDQVDLHTGTVCLEPGTTKNKQARVFYLTGELLDVVQRQWEIRNRLYPDCPWVFFRNGKQIKDFRKAWVTACRKTGLEEKIPHDFRRSAVRNMVRAGIPERVAQDLSGHKTRSVFERYNIVSEGDRLEAANRLDQYLKKWVGTVTENVTAATTSTPIPTHSSQHPSGGCF